MGEEERQKLILALKEGRVKWSDNGEEYWARAGIIKPGNEIDFTVVSAKISSVWGPWYRSQGGMEIAWQTKSAGFGTLTIFLGNDGKVKAHTEGMSKEFCKQVLGVLVDGWEER